MEQTKKTSLWKSIKDIIVILGAVFILRTFVFGLYHVPTQSAEPTILVGERLFGNKFIYFFKDVARGDYIVCEDPYFKYDKSSPLKSLWQKHVGFGIPFLIPSGPDNWTKRVIAIPGDTIEGIVEDGKTIIYLNGEKLDETEYVNPYPLIRLKKTYGLIDADKIGSLPVPDFLRKRKMEGYYTYDPEKSFEDQPFYNMTKENAVKDLRGDFLFRKPYSPIYGRSEGGVIRDIFGRIYYEESIDNFGPITLGEGKYWCMGDNRQNSADSRFWGVLDKSQIHGKASYILWSIDSVEPLWLFDLLKYPIEFWTKKVRWNRCFKGIN
jgi:signal peptidase I